MNDQATPAASERLHALDLVRAAALLLGIVFHAAIPFLPGFEEWLVADKVRSWPVAWLAFGLHTFRMTTFFVLAGFFGRLLLVRRGTSGFVRDRAKRIGAPLLIFWLPVILLFGVALLIAIVCEAVPSTAPTEPPPMSASEFSLTHLWFLYVLLILYAAALLVRAAAGVVDREGKAREALAGWLGAFLKVPLLPPLLLAVPVAALLLAHPAWAEFWGIPTPDRGLIPNRAALGSYGLAFAFGWWVHRTRAGFAALARWWAIHLVLALVLTVACLTIASLPLFEPQLAGRERTVFAALYAAAGWLWTFGLIGAALRFIRRESPVIRYLADSSYWLYIVHLPLLVALEAPIAAWPIPAEIKLVLVVAVATALMLASYRWWVRPTFLAQLLNGRRYPRKRGAKPETAAA